LQVSFRLSWLADEFCSLAKYYCRCADGFCSLAKYYCRYADRFCSLAKLTSKADIDGRIPAILLCKGGEWRWCIAKLAGKKRMSETNLQLPSRRERRGNVLLQGSSAMLNNDCVIVQKALVENYYSRHELTNLNYHHWTATDACSGTFTFTFNKNAAPRFSSTP